MSGVFINYRREDAKSEAGRLFDWLSRYFGKEQVFMDVSGSIEPGLEFDKVIEKAVSSCDVLIVVIGQNWLTATDETGRRRLDNPNDFVRMEVAAALRRDIRVIPVLVQEAAMPDEGSLPEDLKRLSKRQASEIDENRWAFDTEQVVKVLEKAGVKKAIPSQSVVPNERAATVPQVTKKFSWKTIAGIALAVILIIYLFFKPKTPTPLPQPEPQVGDTQPSSILPVPEPSVPTPPKTSVIDISGSWRDPTGTYNFQQSGSNVEFQFFNLDQVQTGRGIGQIKQDEVSLSYERLIYSPVAGWITVKGRMTLQVSPNGMKMTGSFEDMAGREALTLTR